MFNRCMHLSRYGSAAYKAIGYASVSSFIYVCASYYAGPTDKMNEDFKHYDLLDHPYPVTVVVTGMVTVIGAKVNFSYNRVSER